MAGVKGTSGVDKGWHLLQDVTEACLEAARLCSGPTPERVHRRRESAQLDMVKLVIERQVSFSRHG